MKQKLIDHVAGILFVTILMSCGLLVLTHHTTSANRTKNRAITPLLAAPIDNIHDPFERALFADCMEIFNPSQHDTNTATTLELFRIKEAQFNSKQTGDNQEKELSPRQLRKLGGMYGSFLLIYVIVLLLTYYGVQTLGVIQFVVKQQRLQHSSSNRHPPFLNVITSIGKNGIYLLLFSPAYVIAYSIRTEFNTDSSVFMILLGVISNGLLVMYAHKFYTFLAAESRKGYVETAIVKNLQSSYTMVPGSLLSWKAIFRVRKQFSGHIFDHIYRNARFQYLATFKEQASFLITGLIIIEMALNIHGHLTYELLRQLLYAHYQTVTLILLGIFYAVKLTEITTDYLVYKESRCYDN